MSRVKTSVLLGMGLRIETHRCARFVTGRHGLLVIGAFTCVWNFLTRDLRYTGLDDKDRRIESVSAAMDRRPDLSVELWRRDVNRLAARREGITRRLANFFDCEDGEYHAEQYICLIPQCLTILS